MKTTETYTIMNTNPFTLEGKRVLVTGASSGIGRAVAVECSRLGATVIATGRNQERLDETLAMLAGEGHTAVPADLSATEDVERLVAECDALDGVALCSGISLVSPMQFLTRGKIQKVFDTNFFDPIELLRLLSKKKKIKSNGSVVTISSMGGTNLFTYGRAGYGASKAALDSYMKFCALELAPKSIRVNTVLPAMVDTPLVSLGTLSVEERAADEATYPLKRYGRPEEVAYAVIYLLSDAASWVTGTSLVIDGGKSLV